MPIDYYNYIALAIFTLLAASVPISFIMASMVLRPDPPGNRVKGTPYESAEEPIGKGMDIDNEYISFFALFLPFEIAGTLLVIWAVDAAKLLSTEINALMLGIAVLSMTLALIGYKFTSDRHI